MKFLCLLSEYYSHPAYTQLALHLVRKGGNGAVNSLLLLILFVISLASGKLLLLEYSQWTKNYFPTQPQQSRMQNIFKRVCLTLQQDKEEWVAIFRDRHTSSISVCYFNSESQEISSMVQNKTCFLSVGSLVKHRSTLPANVSICTSV